MIRVPLTQNQFALIDDCYNVAAIELFGEFASLNNV